MSSSLCQIVPEYSNMHDIPCAQFTILALIQASSTNPIFIQAFLKSLFRFCIPIAFVSLDFICSRHTKVC